MADYCDYCDVDILPSDGGICAECQAELEDDLLYWSDEPLDDEDPYGDMWEDREWKEAN